MKKYLPDESLPGFFQDADAASLRGQRLTLIWSGVRLAGALMAAIGGALAWKVGRFDVWGCVALVGFSAALIAEIVLATQQPERDWYSGRALAESSKTLAWRFAVVADPFFADLNTREARKLMRSRLEEVAAKGKDRITLGSDEADVTTRMLELRAKDFATRRGVYLEERIKDQRNWYAGKAEQNKRHALMWRVLLIAGEVVAVVLAGGRAFGAWDVDLSGILAAVVAGGAAWLGLRQHSSLASAYSVAASELSLSYGELADTDEADWALAVADAEEAISREHTMWLASRTGGGH